MPATSATVSSATCDSAPHGRRGNVGVAAACCRSLPASERRRHYDTDLCTSRATGFPSGGLQPDGRVSRFTSGDGSFERVQGSMVSHYFSVLASLRHRPHFRQEDESERVCIISHTLWQTPSMAAWTWPAKP